MIFFFSTFRPPAKTTMVRMFNSHFYNLTMTYSLKSDILFGYGGIEDLSSGDRISPARNIAWRTPEKKFAGYFIFKL